MNVKLLGILGLRWQEARKRARQEKNTHEVGYYSTVFL